MNDREAPPSTPAEPDVRDTMVRWWSEILERPETEIGEDSDFFELGGNSLMAINLLERVNQRFALELEVLALLENSRFDSFLALTSGPRTS